MKTIPEIAEDLRTHINNDNAAKRLIVEHILPLIGMNFGNPEDAYNAVSYTEYLEDRQRDAKKLLENDITTLTELSIKSAELDSVILSLKRTSENFL